MHMIIFNYFVKQSTVEQVLLDKATFSEHLFFQDSIFFKALMFFGKAIFRRCLFRTAIFFKANLIFIATRSIYQLVIKLMNTGVFTL